MNTGVPQWSALWAGSKMPQPGSCLGERSQPRTLRCGAARPEQRGWLWLAWHVACDAGSKALGWQLHIPPPWEDKKLGRDALFWDTRAQP